MNNANNKFIALTYKLYVDGDHGKEMVEEAKADRPFHFISGFGFALDAFEQQVISLEKGAQFSFSHSKDEANGDNADPQVASLDRTIFHVNGKFDSEHIYEDAIVPLQNAEGQRFYGRVLEVGNDKVKIDMNHPLAGEPLDFDGEILVFRGAKLLISAVKVAVAVAITTVKDVVAVDVETTTVKVVAEDTAMVNAVAVATVMKTNH